MKKSDIKTRRTFRGATVPALNVKVYQLGIDANDIAEQFSCDRATAEQALQYAFASQQEQFWEQVQELAELCLKDSSVKVYSDGRSGGWLVVDNLAPLESWNALDVSRWAFFARSVARDIAWRTSAETLRDAIDANQWAKPGAERYNFVDTPTGPRCIADLKAEAKAAGFGPVIRN